MFFFVLGTLLTLLTALSTVGVHRLIYCSSMSVAIGYDSDVTDVITEDTPLPAARIFEPYASSKLAGERLVLGADSMFIIFSFFYYITLYNY